MKGPRLLQRILLPVAACVAGLAIISVISFYQNNTIYPEGYSEEEFHTLRPGVTEEEVYRRLGPPLARVEEFNPETWYYNVKSGKGNFNLTGSAKVEFNLRSQVARIFGEAGSLTEGMSKTEVLQVLGDPQMTRPASDVILYYSQSGGAGFHEVRIIELDAGGRVVRLVAQRDHD